MAVRMAKKPVKGKARLQYNWDWPGQDEVLEDMTKALEGKYPVAPSPAPSKPVSWLDVE